VQLRYNYRAYLTPAECSAAGRALGCARVVWNDALAHRRDAHEAGEGYPSDAAMSARLTASKATPERAWLNEVSPVVLQQSLADLDKAYRSFFSSLSGKRKGPKVEPPRFKSRKDSR
jgi:putative transposase